MAHFAELDENNVVLRVIVIANSELLDESGNESEAKGVEFCRSLFGPSTIWVQTSYNGKFRKNYAAVGFTYDSNRDAFIAPKVSFSWILEENTCQWVPPVPYPIDGLSNMTAEAFPGHGTVYMWSEEKLNWVPNPDYPSAQTS